MAKLLRVKLSGILLNGAKVRLMCRGQQNSCNMIVRATMALKAVISCTV